MTVSFWDFSVSAWRIVFSLVVLGAAAWFTFRQLRTGKHTRGFLANELLRLLIVALFLFTLFRPERVHRSTLTQRPLVAILGDASGSMATRDVLAPDGRPLSRATWLAAETDAAFWRPLETDYDVAVSTFSPPPDPESDAEAGTDINSALEDTLDKYDDLRAVMLLSDGDWNLGRAPVSAATRLRLRDIPVFSVSVGSDRFLPDIELVSVAAPAYALMDEHVSLPFTVQSRLPREVKTTILVRQEGHAMVHKNITIPAMARYQDSVVLVPRTRGTFTFTMEIPVERDEVFKGNNAKRFRMALRSELLKVLVIDSAPRWEYRFLHNALSRDPGVMVRCLLLHPGLKPARTRNAIPRFPATRDELSQYDVVFLGDVGIAPDELTDSNMELLKGLVEQQGSGLVFLPGMRGRQLSLQSSAIAPLLPVVLDETKPAGNGFSLPERLALTARGRDHLLTLLAPDAARNLAIWRQLPGTYWHAPVIKAKAGAEVLAVHSTSRNRFGRVPLLVTSSAGNGKVLFMGTDGAWRWRRGVEDKYHYRFWGQVVRWMAHQRHMAHQEGIRFFFTPETPERGKEVFLHATVFDASGFPLPEGTVDVRITGPSGRAESLRLASEPGGWGVYTGAFTPREGGRHRITITCEEANRELTTELNVSSPTREVAGRPARPRVLAEISAITGGAAGTTDDLEELVGKISILPERKPVEKRFRLWSSPLWCAALIGLLGVYWTCRKLLGLI